ncbi:hypothetical protein GCM10020229_03580 [Kitasatospora albolonga]
MPSAEAQGYALPDYPDEPQTDEERDVPAPAYDKDQGLRGQTVLREGKLRPPRPAPVKKLRTQGPPAHRHGRLDPGECKTNVSPPWGQRLRFQPRSRP